MGMVFWDSACATPPAAPYGCNRAGGVVQTALECAKRHRRHRGRSERRGGDAQGISRYHAISLTTKKKSHQFCTICSAELLTSAEPAAHAG